MLGKRNFVNLSLVLEVFRKYYLVDCRSIVRPLLQTLLDDHIEVLRDPLWNRLIFLFLDFLLELFYVRSIVWILVRAHLVENDS